VGNASHPIRILIADDHALFRDGLRRLLEAKPGFRVVGEAANGEEAIERTRALKPDVVLLDLFMPRGAGMEVLGAIHRQSLSVRTLILATTVEPLQIVEALVRGASGIVCKDSTSQLLYKSLHAVMAGEYWIGRRNVSDLIRELKKHPPTPPQDVREKHWNLTIRESQIIGEISSGRANKEIAQTLGISEQTVKHHLTSIFDKLGVFNRLELALFSIHHDWVKDSSKLSNGGRRNTQE
jgi:two-component system, NarL family, nitrate/nitrite response regulator NarL